MTKTPAVATVLVNWNGRADTLECLASLQADGGAGRILVVDNGSQDGSVGAIRSAFPNVMVLAAGENLGFTGGNNLGIDCALAAGAEYVFLLNNDTTVEPGAIGALIGAAESHPRYGILTPVIHYFDRPHEAWFAGSQLDLAHGIAVHDNSNVPARSAGVRGIPWASGCAMLVRGEWIRELAGFDPRYFVTWEDVDLSLRAAAVGAAIGLAPGARIYHKVSRTVNQHCQAVHYYHVRNHLLLVRTHGGPEWRRTRVLVMASRMREDLRAIRHREPNGGKMLRILLRAFRDHFDGRYGRCEAFEPGR